MAGLLGPAHLLCPVLLRNRVSASTPTPIFEEILADVSGIHWHHENGMSEAHHLPETMGPGVAFLDFDNDGWMDIFLVNSGAADFYNPATPIGSALFKNNRDGTFSDVTRQSGVRPGAFGMGVAVGDYDNDGYPDMFVSAYGRPVLYKNNGDGTFADVSEAAGLGQAVFNGHWTSSAVWFDYDNDGRLDLFVCSYLDYGSTNHVSCGDNKLGKKYYCIPRVFRGTSSLLFHNNGDGTFTEVGHETAVGKLLGKALGVVATDINNDGLLDLFVSNDTMQNFLFVNRGRDSAGKTKWEEMATIAGVGFSSNGQARSGMGVDAADIDMDGWDHLFVSNIDQEMFSLYRNNRDETFTDISSKQGLAQATRLLSGWGVKFFDYDNDGSLDLLLACGHPDDMIENYSPQTKYREPLLLFHNDNGKLRPVGTDAGPLFSKAFAARGLAIGDYNNDGRMDVLVGVNGGSPILLKNNSGRDNHWLGLKLQGTRCNRDAIGARITWSADGVRRTRLKKGGGSYLSAHDPREVLGLGGARKLDWLEIHWPAPGNHTERYENLPLDRYIKITEKT